MSNINSIRSKNQIYNNKNLQYVHAMKQMYKIKPVLQTMLCYWRKGGMGVPSDMHTETNMRESQTQK